MNLLHEYINGNYSVKLYDDGTKIRENNEDRLISSFPENIDIKISDKCDAGCAFCHENSSPNGALANFNHEFLYSLRAGTELAIGGGNIFENEDLYMFLKWCKSKGIIANITVNQNHLSGNYSGDNWEKHYNTTKIFDWMDNKEVYGVGISYNGNSKELDEIFKIKVYEHIPLGNTGFSNCEKVSANKYKKNCVIHVINGVHSFDSIMKLANKGYKLLILGYKDLRRGHDYKGKNEENIVENQKSIYNNIHKIIASFEVVSFDNLALEQLNVRRLFTTEEWNEFYMGDDGQFTMYIDLVKEEFAKNSTSLKRHGLLGTIDEMFKIVKSA
jgi:hypothetical protein